VHGQGQARRRGPAPRRSVDRGRDASRRHAPRRRLARPSPPLGWESERAGGHPALEVGGVARVLEGILDRGGWPLDRRGCHGDAPRAHRHRGVARDRAGNLGGPDGITSAGSASASGEFTARPPAASGRSSSNPSAQGTWARAPPCRRRSMPGGTAPVAITTLPLGRRLQACPGDATPSAAAARRVRRWRGSDAGEGPTLGIGPGERPSLADVRHVERCRDPERDPERRRLPVALQHGRTLAPDGADDGHGRHRPGHRLQVGAGRAGAPCRARHVGPVRRAALPANRYSTSVTASRGGLVHPQAG
jgi:hypothetical protein